MGKVSSVASTHIVTSNSYVKDNEYLENNIFSSLKKKHYVQLLEGFSMFSPIFFAVCVSVMNTSDRTSKSVLSSRSVSKKQSLYMQNKLHKYLF